MKRGDKMNLQLAAVLSDPTSLLQKYPHGACQVTQSLHDHKEQQNLVGLF